MSEIIRPEEMPPLWWCEKHWREALTRESCGCPQSVRVRLQSLQTKNEGPATVWVWLVAMGER